jgi:uncharacterized coiled-coil DUF342 family protein
MKSLNCLLVAATALSLQGCLQTRESAKEIEEKQVLKKTIGNLQASTADVNSRFQDLEDEQRKLGGRVEALEVRLQQATAKIDKGAAGADAKMKEKDDIYREEFTKLGAEVAQLKQSLQTMLDEQQRVRAAAEAAASAAAAKAAEKPRSPYAVAEELFDKKQWRDAVLQF